MIFKKKNTYFNVTLTLLLLVVVLSAFVTCKKIRPNKFSFEEPIKLTLTQANSLAELPLACLHTEYPNKLGQTLENADDLKEPHALHPAFYGCFDWHSAVHAHWSLVKLLKRFPRLENADLIKSKLRQSISKRNIKREVLYFHGKQNKSFERTYGWAWLLKLAEELHTWDNTLARELEQNLSPLTDLIVQYYKDFLPKLHYPIRVGEHRNTAFGLAFAWDYASTLQHLELKKLIEARAKDFYLNDEACPIHWEPSGFDFLSPCLEEIDLMRRVLKGDEFKSWMNDFMPQLKSQSFTLAVGEVTDRTDGHLVHLDGLNFSRAWVLYGLANQHPEYRHLINTANEHVTYSLPHLVNDSYEGSHWLGTFAIYALDINFEK